MSPPSPSASSNNTIEADASPVTTYTVQKTVVTETDHDVLADLEIEKMREALQATETKEDDSTDKKKKKKKEKDPAVPVHRLFRFATKLDLLMVVVAAIGSACTGAVQPATIIVFGKFMERMIGAITNGADVLDETYDLILIFVYLGVGILFVAYISHALWVLSGERQALRIKLLYVHSILRQDMGWFDQAEHGSLTTRLATDIQMIQDGISEKMGTMITMFAAFVSGFIIAFVEGWNMAVVILATLPILGVTGGVLGYLFTMYTKGSQDTYASAGAIVEQVFSGIRTVYSFSLQDRFTERYNKELEKARKIGIRRGSALGVGFGVFMFTLFASFGLSFWYGSKLIKEDTLTPVQVIVVFITMMISTMSLLSMPPGLAAVASACGAAARIFQTIDRIPVIDPDDEGGLKPDQIKGNFEFRNVTFQYPTRPDITVLENFNVTINAGMTVAFVGSSGSGKSTGVQLIQRFYDPTEGQVLLDGHDIKEYNVRWLRQQIGVVSQEPVLFNMSIRKNLLMGVSGEVSEKELIEACKKANCHNFITQLPKGYDTQVGEHGGMLSGGQKQRIAIARAILKNPAILLLDEATSALDTESERLVQKALDSASQNRTTLVIAHRLSTIRNADLIVVMQQGKVVEQGQHDELIQRKGVYADLVKKQEIGLEKEDDSDKDANEKATEPLERIMSDASYISDKVPSIDMKKRPSIVSSIDGYEIKLRKAKEEKKRKQKQSAPFFKVLFQMRPEWPIMFIGMIGAMIGGAVFPAFALVYAKVIALIFTPDIDIMPGPLKGANLYAFLFVMLGIAMFLGMSVQITSFETAGERYTQRLRRSIFQALMKQEIGYFDHEDHNVGAITSQLAVDAKNVNEMVTKVWGDVSQLISTAITGFVIAFVHSWKLTLICLTTVPFLIGGAAYETYVEVGFVDKTQKANIQTGEVAGEAIKEIRTVASLGKQSYFEDRYAKAAERPHKHAIRKAFLASFGFALTQSVLQFSQAVTFYGGMRLMVNQEVDYTALIIVMLAVMLTCQGLGRSSVFVSTIAKAKHAAISAFEILERQPSIDPDLEGIEPERGTIRGDVAFENIAFRYPARQDVTIFDGNFSVDAKAGQTVALVGPSGCGKSTTIGMLQRWYDALEGTVRLDGHNVQSFTLGNLRSHMALVSQEPVLFDLSIGDNIRFGVDGDVTQEQIEEACKAANIHRFISSLPKGYDTRVGDKGSQLSGGQKQRIAIARALIRNPKVLLLDEATSALDSESEKLVQAAIDNVLSEGGRTTITIAHRLSTIQNADCIFVIKNGRVVEKGTHWELLKLNGVYKRLVMQQTLDAHHA